MMVGDCLVPSRLHVFLNVSHVHALMNTRVPRARPHKTTDNGYTHDGNTGGSPEKFVNFQKRPEQIDGIYEIAISYNREQSPMATNVQVVVSDYPDWEVEFGVGNFAFTETEMFVDMSQPPDPSDLTSPWHVLGNFEFPPVQPGVVVAPVRVSNQGANGFVVADGVRFTLMDDGGVRTVACPTVEQEVAAVCFGASTAILLANDTAVPITSLSPGMEVVDVDGNRHVVRRVHRSPSADTLIRFRPGAIAPNVPTADLTMTASHLLSLPGGSMVPAGIFAESLANSSKREFVVRTKLGGWDGTLNHGRHTSVYHIELGDWVVLPVHGIPCESAAVTPRHLAKRAQACPTCPRDKITIA